MKACSGAHHWAREFSRHGHTVKLICAQDRHTLPAQRQARQERCGRRRGDLRSGVAAHHALRAGQDQEQQSQLMMVHRARQRFVQARTATINRIRGLLSECGIVLPLKASTVRRQAALHLEDLPGYANTVIGDCLSEVTRLDERIAQYDVHIRNMARGQTQAQRLMRLMGVGEVSATAIVAMVGKAREFSTSRQFTAWLGLVPGQYSSGGKTRLGRITKAGDPYLRSSLIMGARAVLKTARDKSDSLSRWARTLQERRGYWKAVGAIAAKNVWSLSPCTFSAASPRRQVASSRR